MKTSLTLASRGALSACLFLSCLAPALAQTPPASSSNGMQRPRICLVLSGGGARGAAHVGVIKVLEEYRVPIDCIAGTSMGSLVGAAYATGMSTADMDKILTTISTELLFKDKPPRQERSMRRKQDDYTILFSPEIGVNDNGEFSFAKGMVSGVQLENVLRSLTRLSGYRNFDKLPIPFRAVATDLVTGQAEVFSKGDVINAMRASMSVPGVIAPAEFDGKILVDGMLTQNLPVEVSRQAFRPDIIIAVNVGTPLLKREQLTSVLGVTGQMLSILTEQNVQASLATLKPTDILISPELGDYSTGAFDDLSKISPLGEAAARKMEAQLRKLSLPPAQYAALRQKQQVASAPDLAPVDEIRIDGLKRVNPASVQYVMETEAGKPLDQKVVDADMRRIYGTGDFDHVAYRIVDEGGGRILAVDAVEKPWGPNYLRFGLGLSSDFSGGAYFNLLASYRETWLNSLGAEWRTDLQVGQNSKLYSEFYQPLNAEGSFFVAPNISVGRRSQYVYRSDERVGQYDIGSSALGLDLGSQFHRYGEIRVGVIQGELRPTKDTGSPLLPERDDYIKQGAFTARLRLDQADSVAFPRHGWWANANIFDSNSAMGADNIYTKWDVAASTTYSFGNHTFSLYAKAGDRLGSDPIPYYDQFQWGGFMQQSGYAPGQLTGQSIRFARLMYYHRLLKGSLFDGAYAGFSLEAGKVGSPSAKGNPSGVLESGSIFIGSDSPLGPVYLGYGTSAEGYHSSYFYLGLPY